MVILDAGYWIKSSYTRGSCQVKSIHHKNKEIKATTGSNHHAEARMRLAGLIAHINPLSMLGLSSLSLSKARAQRAIAKQLDQRRTCRKAFGVRRCAVGWSRSWDSRVVLGPVREDAKSERDGPGGRWRCPSPSCTSQWTSRSFVHAEHAALDIGPKVEWVAEGKIG